MGGGGGAGGAAGAAGGAAGAAAAAAGAAGGAAGAAGGAAGAAGGAAGAAGGAAGAAGGAAGAAAVCAMAGSGRSSDATKARTIRKVVIPQAQARAGPGPIAGNSCESAGRHPDATRVAPVTAVAVLRSAPPRRRADPNLVLLDRRRPQPGSARAPTQPGSRRPQPGSGHARLETGAGDTLVATPEHPFWLANRGWTLVGELRIGTSIASASGGSRSSILRGRTRRRRCTIFEVEV